jgi:FlaA1/EpsC-like NDP-sugar epimerase
MRFFNHYVPAPIFMLVAVDAIALAAAIWFGVSLRFGDSNLAFTDFLPTAVSFALVMQMSMATFGLYQREFRGRLREVITRLLASFLVGFALMSFVFYVVPDLYLGRGAFGLALLAAAGLVLLIRALFFRWAESGVLLPRVLVLGTGTRALTIAATGVAGGGRMYSANIVGYLPG